MDRASASGAVDPGSIPVPVQPSMTLNLILSAFLLNVSLAQTLWGPRRRPRLADLFCCWEKRDSSVLKCWWAGDWQLLQSAVRPFIVMLC